MSTNKDYTQVAASSNGKNMRNQLKSSTNNMQSDRKSEITNIKSSNKEDPISLFDLLLKCEEKFAELGQNQFDIESLPLNCNKKEMTTCKVQLPNGETREQEKELDPELYVADMKIIINELEKYANATMETITILYKIIEYYNRFKVVKVNSLNKKDNLSKSG